MGFYCGLDLGGTHCQVCVINDAMEIQVERKVRNELSQITELLAQYDPAPQCVVESTFNWYWLVDGLMEAGYEICLAHALGVRLISGAKVKTDRRDAFALAKLLRAGLIPQAYICPKATRPVQAVQWYPRIERYFDRQLARHRGRGRKLIAYDIIAHKLACAVYHILRDGTEYQETLLFGG